MEKIRRHPLYIFGADLPLRAFYAAAVLMRRAPQWIIATYITVALLSMLSLAIAFFWWDSLMSGTKGVRTLSRGLGQSRRIFRHPISDP
jgi:hypothetical protein